MTIESDDLSARARRGELDEASEKQLQHWLARSQEARFVHRAGLEFDAGDSVLAGDEALAQRIAERVLAARPVPLSPRRAWLKPALGVASVAAVVFALLPFAQRNSGGTPSASQRGGPALSAPSRLEAPAAVPSAPSPVQDASSSSGEPAQETVAAASGSSTRAQGSGRAGGKKEFSGPLDNAASSRVSASELFQRANRARREARSELAASLYRSLQQQYPTSAEALSAEMALGLLELKADRAQAALSHFSAYLTRSPEGALAPEALWGQAQALSSLGRDARAADSLQLLLKRFPESAYATAARAKLEAMR